MKQIIGVLLIISGLLIFFTSPVGEVSIYPGGILSGYGLLMLFRIGEN